MSKGPPSHDDKGWCPFLGRGCIGEACALWVRMWGKDTPDGEMREDANCTFVWDVILAKHALTETARITAGHDKVANETAKVGQIIAFGLQSAERERVGIEREHH